MKIFTAIIIYLSITSTGFAEPASYNKDWGKNGHRATGEIAESYLSKRTKKEIDKILNGKSLALVSTFGDEIKSEAAYRKYDPWHYVNLPEGDSLYSEKTAAPEGDILMGIKKCVEVLKDNHAPMKEKEFYLKMLVHFMGDLHQPLHTGRAKDKGGNDIQVRWFNEGTNLHSVWDSKMIGSYQMSYTELAENRDRIAPEEEQQIAAGSLEDWMYESKALSQRVYDSAQIGEKLGYRYMYDWFAVVREQLQKGGIRLATVLNEIFG